MGVGRNWNLFADITHSPPDYTISLFANEMTLGDVKKKAFHWMHYVTARSVISVIYSGRDQMECASRYTAG